MKLPPILVNATCIGQHPDGLAIYTRHIVVALIQTSRDHRFVVYVNRRGAKQLSVLKPYSNVLMRMVTGWMAPEYGSGAHALRWMFSQVLAWRYPRTFLFTPSQLEMAFFHRCQMVTFHDLIPLRFPAEHRRQVLVYRYFLGAAVRRAAAVIVPSTHTKVELEGRYRPQPGTVHVIYHGLPQSPSVMDSFIPSTVPFILYLGRLSDTKNVAGLIAAYQHISRQIPHKLVIAGQGDRSRLSKVVSNGQGTVEFQGYVSPDRKQAMLRKADVFVFPSFDEGFGFPPLEAMACGCPVVVARAGSLPEVCGSAACYVDPYDPRSIAEGILRVVMDRAFRDTLIRKGYRRVQRFQWSVSVRRHWAVISTLNSRCSPRCG